MSLEFRHQRWKKRFDKLEEDYDNLVKWWKKNKPCDCCSEEDDIFCKHFDKILKKTLGDRIDELYEDRLKIGISTFNAVMKK